HPFPPALRSSGTHKPARIGGSTHTAGAETSVWRVIFSPSPVLVARGVKLDTIRGRLLEIGHILSVTPQVMAGGSVSFEFIVATEDEAQLTAWPGGGLAC